MTMAPVIAPSRQRCVPPLPSYTEPYAEIATIDLIVFGEGKKLKCSD